ncbi:MAG: hypothetical protein ACK5HR_03735 [Mycoplasmatales bacterium]
MSFEDFLKEYWFNNIKWILKNPKKYNFIKTCNTYPIIKKEYTKNQSTTIFLEKIKIAIETKEIAIAETQLVFNSFLGIRDSLVLYVLESQKTKVEIDKISNDFLNRLYFFLNYKNIDKYS